MNASVLWDIVSRAKIECHEAAGRVAFILSCEDTSIGHERSLSNRLRTWSHLRRISFLRADCIFEFQFFSSHLEITLLFCLRYFRYCTHCNVLLRVLHRAVYRS